LLSVNDTVKFMFIVQIAMYRYDMYVKVTYNNFDNKRRYDDDDEHSQDLTSITPQHLVQTVHQRQQPAKA